MESRGKRRPSQTRNFHDDKVIDKTQIEHQNCFKTTLTIIFQSIIYIKYFIDFSYINVIFGVFSSTIGFVI